MTTASWGKWLLTVTLPLACVTPALGWSGRDVREPFCVQRESVTMGSALLVKYFQALPEPRQGDTPEKFAARLDAALDQFRQEVKDRYTEGTLRRLLLAPDVEARRGAALALGMHGTMLANRDLASRLRDGDQMVRRLASDALWSIWYRADTEENAKELTRLMELRDQDKSIAGLNDLIKKAPDFAEAYNQRAIRYYQKKDYEKSIADCDKVLQLNPYHFGAASGKAQSHMNLKEFPEALKAYRKAFRLNPNMDGVRDAIELLENALENDGKK